MKIKLLLVLPILFFTLHGSAQTIQELSFISGRWGTTMSWGELEEYWSKPLGNNMVCAFRCVNNGEVVFYEFIVIEKLHTDKVPVMRLRHFNAGNIAWEDKNDVHQYPLVKLEPAKARFEASDKSTAMTFIRVAPEKLMVVLERTDKDGKPIIDTFNYALKK